MIEIITIIFISILVALISVKQKVDNSLIKEKYRKENPNFNTKASLFYVAFSFLILTSPIIYIYNIKIYIILLLFIVSLTRTITFYKVMTIRAIFKDTNFQKNTELTLIENFISPIIALVIFGIYDSIVNNISIFWYLITPFVGFFLLYALKEDNLSFSRETKLLLKWTFLLGLTESLLFLIAIHFPIKIVHIKEEYINTILNLNQSYIIIIYLFFLSKIPLLFIHFKDAKESFRKKENKELILNGTLHGIHNFLYSISFVFLGPIFLIVRRGMLIPLQNLYLNLKEGKSIKDIFNSLKKPLLHLRGGKDFIIAFVDFLFNRVVKYLISFF